METLRLIGEFILAVVEEWRGWLTGSLPMAVIAVAALIRPDIAPLALWEWIILIFVAGFVCAVFRVYRSVRLAEKALNAQLVQIGLDRPFKFVAPDFGVSRIGAGKEFLLHRVTLVFENVGDKMINYTVRTLHVTMNGMLITSGNTPNIAYYISSRDTASYGLAIVGEGYYILSPLTMTFTFEIEYDNVPPVLRRTTERTVRYVFTSLEPMESTNTILHSAER